MKCHHCNFESVPEGAKFCPNCGESIIGEKKPSTNITSNVTANTLHSGEVTGVSIGTVGDAHIGEAQIKDAHVRLSPETEDVLVEKLIESINNRLGITLDSLKSGTAEIPEEDQRTVNTVINEIETKEVPISPSSLYKLGMLAASAKDHEKAVRYLRRTIQSDPDNKDAYHAIAWLQQMRAVEEIEKGNLKPASALLKEAHEAALHTNDLGSIVQQGYNVKTMAQVAEAQQKKNEATAYYKEAATIFLDVLAVDLNNAGALNGLGNVYHSLGELDEAIAQYTHAIEIVPTYTAAYHDLAIAYEAKMRVDDVHAYDWCQKACEAWNRTFQLAKNDPGFSKGARERILDRIDALDKRCGERKSGV
jgi:tetratricopeptide (TPR) repeat protein